MRTAIRCRPLFLALLATVPLAAQQRPWGPLARPGLVDSVGPLDVDRIPLSVADAEREGASWPRMSPPSIQAVGAYAFDSSGESARTCTVGQANGPSRSGEFLIGAQLEGWWAGVHGRPAKIWWRPRYPALEYNLLVRGRSLTHPADTMRMTFTDWAASGRNTENWFFPSGTIFPTAGRWMVVATHGANWGCFIVESK